MGSSDLNSTDQNHTFHIIWNGETLGIEFAYSPGKSNPVVIKVLPTQQNVQIGDIFYKINGIETDIDDVADLFDILQNASLPARLDFIRTNNKSAQSHVPTTSTPHTSSNDCRKIDNDSSRREKMESTPLSKEKPSGSNETETKSAPLQKLQVSTKKVEVVKSNSHHSTSSSNKPTSQHRIINNPSSTPTGEKSNLEEDKSKRKYSRLQKNSRQRKVRGSQLLTIRESSETFEIPKPRRDARTYQVRLSGASLGMEFQIIKIKNNILPMVKRVCKKVCCENLQRISVGDLLMEISGKRTTGVSISVLNRMLLDHKDDGILEFKTVFAPNKKSFILRGIREGYVR